MVRDVAVHEAVTARPLDTSDQALETEADRLYERDGKSLEQEHWGQYVAAIAPDGRTLLGTPLRQVLERAHEAFGPGNFVFKIGEIATWRVR